jgi:hypothetical protein
MLTPFLPVGNIWRAVRIASSILVLDLTVYRTYIIAVFVLQLCANVVHLHYMLDNLADQEQ